MKSCNQKKCPRIERRGRLKCFHNYLHNGLNHHPVVLEVKDTKN